LSGFCLKVFEMEIAPVANSVVTSYSIFADYGFRYSSQ